MGSESASRDRKGAPTSRAEPARRRMPRDDIATAGRGTSSGRVRRVVIQADRSALPSGDQGRAQPMSRARPAVQRNDDTDPGDQGGASIVERSAGDGRSKITLRGPGGSLGSVNVRPVDKTAVEATDLSVAPEHRGQGYGKDLVAAAARVGARSGKSRVKLGSQDNGSGKLDGWYQSLGFSKTGKGDDGYTRFEAPTSGLG